MIKSKKQIKGIILITIGVLFFLINFINIPNINWRYVWPIILIIVGIDYYGNNSR